MQVNPDTVTAQEADAIQIAPVSLVSDLPLSEQMQTVTVYELPSYADLGAEPVVTLTFGEKAQLVIEQNKLTYGILKSMLLVLAAVNTISGYVIMETDPWYKQRRIWATIFSVIATVLAVFKVAVPDWVTAAGPDLMVQIATAVSGAIAGILALWSYVKPKTSTPTP